MAPALNPLGKNAQTKNAQALTVPSAAAVRLAGLADAHAVASLYREVWSDDAGGLDEAQDWLEHGGALVLESGEGTMVAALRWREDAGSWRLDRLAALPDYRGQGFGRWLMTKVEALAIKGNVPALFLALDPEHGELLGYYRRLGYRQADACGPRVLLTKPLGGAWQYK
jgi:GNAT superfamily N-acetyltransferase